MHKLILLIVLLLAVCNSAYAVPPPNAIAMPALTPMAQNTPGNAVSQACDQYGVCQVGLSAAGGGGLNAVSIEDTVAGSGFAGIAPLAVRSDALGSITNTDGDFSPIVVNNKGAVFPDVIYSAQANPATGLLKLEDAAAASGDALVGVAGSANINLASRAADGDYVTPALSISGAQMSVIAVDPSLSGGQQAAWNEDSAIASLSTGVKIVSQTQDPLSVDQDASGDAAFAKVDRAGRTITTLAPAGESFQNCMGAAATGVGDNTIKAAVASNRIYVTSLSCTNTAAVASAFTIKDGAATTMWIGGISNSTLQGVAVWNHTFPVPLRGSVNTALVLAMGTTATSTTCCASGYISVN